MNNNLSMNALRELFIEAPGKNKNIIVSQLLIFFIVSICIDKLLLVSFAGGINASVQTFSLFAGFLYISLLLINTNKVQNNLNYKILTSLLLLLLLIFCAQAYRSLDVARSITYLILLFLNMAVFFIFSRKLDVGIVKYSNKGIFYLGFLIISSIFIMYLNVVIFQSSSILGDRARWDVGSSEVYEVLFGRYIAFQGYSGDPNLVGLGVSAILFFGIYIEQIKKSVFFKPMNIILVFILFTSFSRGAIFALIVTMFFCGFILRKKEYRNYLYFISFMAVIGFLLTSVINASGFETVNPFNKFGRSVGRRSEEWSVLFYYWMDNPLLGGGLRYDEILLGKYAENSYLGILVNTGVFGLATFLMFISGVYFSAIKRWRANKNEEIFPWIAYGAYLIISMGFISMEIKPHIWITFAVLASFSFGSNWLRSRTYLNIKQGVRYES